MSLSLSLVLGLGPRRRIINSVLNDLTDVTITNPSNGQELVFDGTIWKNAWSASDEPVIALNDLTDVTITNPSNGQELVFDGTIWENA